MKYLLLLFLLLSGLHQAAASSPAPLRVVATTTLVGDVVKTIGGPGIDLSVLLGTGLDPHTFEPSPRDAAAVARAQVLFINGAGLETFLESLLTANTRGVTLVVDLSKELPLVKRKEAEEHHEEHAGEHHHDHGEFDPHVWLDPNLVMGWTKTIARVLTDRDPERADLYRQRAEAYLAQLEELDRWIKAEVQSVPATHRRLVTDHDEFGYFADRYGFTVTGALLPNVTTAAETSAREMADLEMRINSTGTRVLVIGQGMNPSLAQRVAHDTGLQLVTLYTGSLSEPGGPAATYLDYMRHNVTALISAMKQNAP